MGGFTPLSLSPSLWLDASDAATMFDATSGGALVIADGSIARLNDKGAFAANGTQATLNNRPLRRVVTGMDSAEFDAVNDQFSITLPSGITDGTLFVATSLGCLAYGITLSAGTYNFDLLGFLWRGVLFFRQALRFGDVRVGVDCTSDC